GTVVEIEGAGRMILGVPVLERLDDARRGDGAGDERDTDRLERARGQGLRRKAGPEAVPVAGHGRKARDAGVAHEVVDLGALDVRTAVIAAAEARISRTRPRFHELYRHVLWIDAPVERAGRVAPDLPLGGRRAQSP